MPIAHMCLKEMYSFRVTFSLLKIKKYYVFYLEESIV